MIKIHRGHSRYKNSNPDAHFLFTILNKSIASSFYRFQNVMCRSKFFELAQKLYFILVPLKDFCAGSKTNFTECKSSLSGTKCLWLPQYVNKFLVWHKKSGSAQNIWGPAKGQGICFFSYDSTVPTISSFVFEVSDSQFYSYFVMFRIVYFQKIFPSFYNFYFLRSRNLCLHPCWSCSTGSFKWSIFQIIW